MKGRHLWRAFGGNPGRATTKPRIVRDRIPGRNKGIGADFARCETLLAQLHEGIDIELVVREDHEILEMLRIGAGVVIEPAQ